MSSTGDGADDTARVRAARPSTARKAPPKLQTNVRTEKASQPASKQTDAPVPAAAVIVEDGDAKDDTDEHLLTVEAKPEDMGGGGSELTVDETANYGGLVKDIIDTNKTLQGAKTNGPVAVGKDAAAREKLRQEIEAARSSLQVISQQVHPLGKSMDNVQEDMETMDKELEFWKEDSIKQSQKLEDELRVTEQSLQPFLNKLQELELQVKEQRNKINQQKAKLHENDSRIQELLRMVVKI
eukprot:TRINITY_DN9277_c0_g1_i1.p1 TRINITY_DN9277_c0_g1~~TRINITY_DN9277_c0_g1_i1.p1  ORF type:complete len:275 (+),score=103.65 TRINITY_DN9277_c0_g1_i1:106-825(+)